MELIKIYQGNIVSGKELHAFLEVGRDFSNWIKQRIERYEFVEGEDFTPILAKSSGGRPGRDYAITINMAKELAMVENNEKGREARRYFIEAEKTLQQLRQNKRLESFMKLEASKDKLSSNIQSIGGTHQDYVQIDIEGRKVLFNGQLIKDETLPDILLKARDFAVGLTNENFKKGMTSLEDVENEHKINHDAVRQTIIDRSKIKPEEIELEDDIKKLDEGNKD